MFSDNNNQKGPSGREIKFILELINTSKFNDAKKEIDKKILKFPNSPILFNMLGAIFAEQKQIKEAIENYKKAIKINPNYAQAYNNLGIVLHKMNKTDEAIENYKKAIHLKNDFSQAFNNLGNAIRNMKKQKEALAYFEKAIMIQPKYYEAYNNLGSTYLELGNKQKAIENYEKAIKIKPNYADVYNNLGTVYSDIPLFEKSLFYFNKAIEINSKNEKSYNNLGNLLSTLGKHDDASKAYYKAIEIKPDYAKAYSNLLFNLNYKIDFDHNLYLSQAKKFAENCKPKKKLSLNYQYEKNPKKLKIGFISADFGNHPGGFFSLSTLRELRKKNFELICYSAADRKDEFSFHFKPLFSKWYLIEKKTDEEVATQIFKDGIHILIEMQGHSAKNRIPIFMHKASPVQVSWLSQGTIGITEIDYIVGSPQITPKNEENHFVEKIWNLPEITQCFTPPDFDVKIKDLPAIKNNFFTFGCVNKLTKINDNVISLWSKILSLKPNSKLLIKNKDLDDKNILQNTLERFNKQKIEKNRLILLGESKTRKELLEIYNQIDISLDPFPFQGNTSTIEAIWMGVPVITLKGDRFLFHFGESINSNLNMHDWIAKNKEEYISKTIKFSSDLKDLSVLRMNLRDTIINSPVFDAKRFSNYFSQMLWDMWKKFNNL